MTLDINQHLNAVSRSVTRREREGSATRAAVLARTYAVSIRRTLAHGNQRRVHRALVPAHRRRSEARRPLVSWAGNASGVVTACEPSSHFAATWEFGGGMSWLDVTLEAEANGARLTITHDSPVSDHWTEYGPGAVGVGWEMGLLGLALYLANPEEPKLDEETFVASDEGKALIAQVSDGWRQAAVAFGTAPEQPSEQPPSSQAWTLSTWPEGARLRAKLLKPRIDTDAPLGNGRTEPP